MSVSWYIRVFSSLALIANHKSLDKIAKNKRAGYDAVISAALGEVYFIGQRCGMLEHNLPLFHRHESRLDVAVGCVGLGVKVKVEIVKVEVGNVEVAEVGYRYVVFVFVFHCHKVS